MIVHRYLADNDSGPCGAISPLYSSRPRRCRTPSPGTSQNVASPEPEAACSWATRPEGLSATELLRRAVERKVACVPGAAFFVDGTGENTLRLNYSNADAATIEDGIKRLATCLEECMAEAGKAARAGA
jgi:2-aminoadipate transaminase